MNQTMNNQSFNSAGGPVINNLPSTGTGFKDFLDSYKKYILSGEIVPDIVGQNAGYLGGLGIGSVIGGPVPGGYPIGTVTGSIAGQYGSNRAKEKLFNRDVPWSEELLSDFTAGLGGLIPPGAGSIIKPTLGSVADDGFDAIYGAGKQSLDDIWAQATKPQSYKPAPSIVDQFKNLNPFKAKAQAPTVNIPLEESGLGKALPEKAINQFAKSIGVKDFDNPNQFGNALVNDVAPTLNKLDANPYGFETYAKNPFIATEQRLAQEGSPLSLRKNALMAQPLEDFTNEFVSGFNNVEGNLDDYFGQAYNTIKSKYGDVKAPTNKIVSAIDEGFGEIGNVSDKSSYPVFRKKAEAIKQDALRLQNSSGAPFSWLKQNRTDINDAIKKFQGAEGVQGHEKSLLYKLKDSLTEGYSDLTTEAIKKGGDPNTLDELLKVNKQYAGYKTDIKSPIGQSLEKMVETGKTPKNISQFLNQFNSEADVQAFSRLTKIPKEKLTDQVYGSILDEQFNPTAFAQRTDGIEAAGQKLYTQGFDANTNTASIKRLHSALTKNRKNLIALGGKEKYLENVEFVNAINKIQNKGKAWENIFRGIENTPNGKKVLIDTSSLENLSAKNPNLFTPAEKDVLNKVVQLSTKVGGNDAKMKWLEELVKKGLKTNPVTGTIVDIASKSSS